jgi:hypothetical protein
VKPLVLHVVLFRPKPDVSDEDRNALLEALQVASTEIPTVREFRIGRRILHGAGYEGLSAEDYPYVAVASFENVDGLKTYLQHPKHDELGRLF